MGGGGAGQERGDLEGGIEFDEGGDTRRGERKEERSGVRNQRAFKLGLLNQSRKIPKYRYPSQTLVPSHPCLYSPSKEGVV
jgi:hypothetical protein